MRGSVGVGFGIAALFAVGVVAVALFGDHQSWFVRAAQGNAARCLAASPCTRLEVNATGAVVTLTPPPLAASSRCAKPNGWKDVKGISYGAPKVIVVCVDAGKAYLYHLGKLPRVDAGPEQWMACAEPTCTNEVPDFIKLTGR